MDTVDKFRRDLLRGYAESVGIAERANYIGGAPLRPVVPLDVGHTVLIIGAYPPARLGAVADEHDVPVADSLGPFEPERYYDGERIRLQKLASELDVSYLSPLGVKREDCWITNLVKVFVFNEGQRQKYLKLGTQPPAGYNREAFESIGAMSIPWLERELNLSRPKLVITLGTEVAGILSEHPRSDRQKQAAQWGGEEDTDWRRRSRCGATPTPGHPRERSQ